MCQKHTSGSHPTLQRKSWASETVVEEEGEEGRAGSKETGDGVNFILLLFCGQEVGEVWRSIVGSAPFIRPPPPLPSFSREIFTIFSVWMHLPERDYGAGNGYI